MAKLLGTVLSAIFLVKSITTVVGGSACQGACVSVPVSCLDLDSCDLGARLELLENGDPSFNVRVVGRVSSQSSYVALGISDDDRMGNDAIVVCMDHKVVQMVTPNAPHSPPQPKAFKSGPITGTSSIINGKLDCSFILPTTVDAGDGLVFNLKEKSVHIFVATGTVNGGRITQHSSKIDNVVDPSQFKTISARATGIAPPSNVTETATTVKPTDKTPSVKDDAFNQKPIIAIVIFAMIATLLL